LHTEGRRLGVFQQPIHRESTPVTRLVELAEWATELHSDRRVGGIEVGASGGDGGEEGRRHGPRAHLVAKVCGIPRRADLGEEPGGVGSTFTFTIPVCRGE
jgi:hypothetical protein